MGYQESYVRVKDNTKFNDLVELTKKLGFEFFDYYGAGPVQIITLKKAIKGTLAEMCEPNINYSFEPGEKFLYFVGERYPQKSNRRLYHKWAPEGLEIYFTECFPTEIFDKKNYATHEEIWLDHNLESLAELVDYLKLEEEEEHKETTLCSKTEEAIFKALQSLFPGKPIERNITLNKI